MVVNAEAGNQDEVGQRLVIDVILNRVDSIYFPDTVEAVIFQPSQFTKPAQTYTERQYELVLEEIERRIDKDIIAFRRDEYHKNIKWEDAYVHGVHYFSKFKEEYRENTL
jgi:N-acetylmuramoyl-L-alanine amidase